MQVLLKLLNVLEEDVISTNRSVLISLNKDYSLAQEFFM